MTVEDEDKTTRRWIVRQIARRLRYRTLDELTGQTVTLHSLRTMPADLQPVVDKVCPGCVFAGPEEPVRIATLAKYSLLDLRFKAPADMEPIAPYRGLSLLKELGFIGPPGDDTWYNVKAGDDDLFGFVTDLRDDIDKNEMTVKLLLKEQVSKPFPSPPSWEDVLDEPSLISFPKTMEIVDACITNSDGVWLNKHFYL